MWGWNAFPAQVYWIELGSNARLGCRQSNALKLGQGVGVAVLVSICDALCGLTFCFGERFKYICFLHHSSTVWYSTQLKSPVIEDSDPFILHSRWYDCWWHVTSSNGNISRVTGHLCGKFTGQRWIPSTKATDTELWRFLWSAPD